MCVSAEKFGIWIMNVCNVAGRYGEQSEQELYKVPRKNYQYFSYFKNGNNVFVFLLLHDYGSIIVDQLLAR